MCTGAEVAIVAAVVGGTAASIHGIEQQKKASRQSRRKQEEANRVQKATASVERSIKRRRAVARARLAQQQNIAEAANLGILGSSPLQGAQASIGASLGTGIASQNRQTISGQQTFDLRQQAQFIEQRGRNQAATFQAIGSFGMSAGAMAASMGGGSKPTVTDTATNN